MVDQKKIEQTDVLKQKFLSAKAVVVADYRGLNVRQMTDLRIRLGEHSIEFKVIKNSLAKLASIGTDFEGIGELFNGLVSIALSYEDELAPARLMSACSKDEPTLEITGGVIEGQVISAGEVRKLATLSSKEVLLAQALSGMKSPISGLVGVLGGAIRNLLYTLEAIKETKNSEA